MSNQQSTAESRLVQALDAAVTDGNGNAELTVAKVQALLARFASDARDSSLPPDLTRPLPDRYARRLLHQSQDLGYSVVVMTWGPGQGTQIHDHCGMWCVEGVWRGCIEVVQYECLERGEDFYRFASRGSVEARAGSAGSLIPPHEYHTIANASEEQPAVTVHVYSGEMVRCNAFTRTSANQAPAESSALDGHWYRRTPRDLQFD
jgi:predicted metal-dependent enzyme (double-stranded beta helix superfamily)